MRMLLALVVLAGCRLYAPPAQARVHHGPAFGTPLTTVVALPAVPAMCTPAECGAVASASRISLELAGYTIVDAELINAQPRRRTTTSATEDDGVAPRLAQPDPLAPPHSDTTTATDVEGPTWQQAPAGERAQLVRDAGGDGLLQTSILASPGAHSWIVRHTVAFTLTTLDGQVVWQSSCTDEEGDHADERGAIEGATRCALESLALW